MSVSITQTELIARIQHLLRHAAAPVVVALDGRCGSGKTTLAAALAQQFPACNLMHMDDFYLPPAERCPGWERLPCANMDLERLLQETLAPVAAGKPALYRAYSCRAGAYLPEKQLSPQPLVILEGSYAHHPMLCGCETLRVFITCSKAEQTRRLRQREGERYAAFAERWIPLEEGYFTAYSIPQCADAVLDTSEI